jgi:hypothetical protein
MKQRKIRGNEKDIGILNKSYPYFHLSKNTDMAIGAFNIKIIFLCDLTYKYLKIWPHHYLLKLLMI